MTAAKPSIRRPRRRSRLAAAVAALAAIAALVSGCTSAPETSHRLPTQTSTPVLSPAPAPDATADEVATHRFYSQVLIWKDCSGGFQCATAQAPIDWAHPSEGAPIHLALIRKPASGHKLGSLFTNPGGPGSSGVDFVRSATASTSARLQQNFDVIGWDPRGVGASSAVTCYDDAGLDKFIYGITPGARGSDEWIANSKKSTTALGAACLENTGPLLGHIDTASTAHDLDMLRNAVGDAKLNYLGFSYGTLIGSIYADMFPKNVGRMTLDGVVDPAQSYDDVTKVQAVGFEDNLRAYVKWCLSQDKSCPFSGSVDGAMSSIAALLARVDAHPIKNSDGRMLGGLTLQTAIILPLYSTSNWPALDTLFKDVSAGHAETAFYLADQYNERDDKGRYASNTIVAFQSINCLDYTFEPDVATMRERAAELKKLAPVMGPYFAYGGIACAGWPFAPVRVPAPVHAAGSAPILVLGTTNDPATPYQNSVTLAKTLENGHLVTWNGDGHTAYGRSNACVQNTVDDYFVKGTVPAHDPKC